MEKTAMPSCFTSEAATSSWVDNGLLAHRRTSAPPAASARARLAVSDVTCRQAAKRSPRSGFSFAKRSRMLRKTGIWSSAQSMRVFPFAASPESFTSLWMAPTCPSSPAPPPGSLRPDRLAERLGFVGFFPGESRIAPPEMPEGRGATINRLAQVERLDDLARLEAEV